MKTHKLTIWQRLLRKPLNVIVETWFPSGAFFGNDYLRPWARFDEKKGIHLSSAALYLINRIMAVGGTEAEIQMEGVTHSGEEIGDWVITVKKKSSDLIAEHKDPAP